MFQTDDDWSEFKIFYSWSVTRNSRCVTRVQINNESTSDQIMTPCLLATTDHNAYISYVTAADWQCRIQESSIPSDQRKSSKITYPACSPIPDLSAKNLLQEYFANELGAGTLHNRCASCLYNSFCIYIYIYIWTLVKDNSHMSGVKINSSMNGCTILNWHIAKKLIFGGWYLMMMNEKVQGGCTAYWKNKFNKDAEFNSEPSVTYKKTAIVNPASKDGRVLCHAQCASHITTINLELHWTNDSLAK